MSVTLSAANCLTWLATICNVSSPSILINEVEKNAATSPDVIFLPYLSGERTPHNNPYAQGVFIGITHTTSRADLTRAVLEGVAFAFADGQDAILKTGTVINEVSVIGGGSQNLFWGKILASALQKPLIYRKHREVGAALGAARLASLAIHQKNPEDIFMPPDIEAVIEPDVYLTEHYSDKYKRFKNMYQRLETFFV
jgi:xylulokinase